MSSAGRSGRRPSAAPWLGVGLAALLFAGQAAAAGVVANPGVTVRAGAYDPWERANRRLFGVGMALDHAVFGPVARTYVAVTPRFVRDRVSAAVFNLGEPSTAMEDILQAKPRRAGRAGLRFVINSTAGVLGMFDVASRLGVPGHESDFGQTLGRYGVQPGPYVYALVAPFNLRDGVGRIVDFVTDPASLIVGPVTSTGGAVRTGADLLDTRVAVDPALRALDDATDPYATVRAAYAQRRAALIDGHAVATSALPDFEPER